MDPKVNRYLLDPATPSGRDDWWHVSKGMVTRVKETYNEVQWRMNLESYIVARADRGCADCISAILECPGDVWLIDEIEIAKEKQHG